VIYSDLNSINPTSTGQPLLADVQAVYQGLYNLFGTKPGERVFLPEFGFDLESELFEIMDDLTTTEVYRRVIETVERWEARVSLDKRATSVVPYPDENKYEVTLVFSIKGVEGQKFEFKGSFEK
jgi:phage baseplate assembly protein W